MMRAHARPGERHTSRRSFTLVELMVVMAILTVLATAVLFALWDVMEEAKAARTRAQVTKLHELVVGKWQGYRTRAISLNIPAGATNNIFDLAAARVLAVRDLMRMELPDRISDVADGPVSIPVPGVATAPRLAPPALWRNYRKKAGMGRWPTTVVPPTWDVDYQGAECLYLIVSSLRDGDGNGLDFFKETEIDDVDGDGMSEIVDAWGNPIMFFRWAPGFATLRGPDGGWGVAGTDDDGANGIDDLGEIGWPGSDDMTEMQSRDAVASPDPFDPMQVDKTGASFVNYALIPLIYSAGPDGIYDLDDAPPGTIPSGGSWPGSYSGFRYINTAPTPNDPYTPINGGKSLIGRPVSAGGPPKEFNSVDNITNHLLAAE